MIGFPGLMFENLLELDGKPIGRDITGRDVLSVRMYRVITSGGKWGDLGVIFTMSHLLMWKNENCKWITQHYHLRVHNCLTHNATYPPLHSCCSNSLRQLMLVAEELVIEFL